MGTRETLQEDLAMALEPGERVEAWRQVVSNAKVEDKSFHTTLALLGPSAFSGAARGAVTTGEMPNGTNLVVVTNRRVLWCQKSRFSGEIVVGGSDSLNALLSVNVVPARIALAKLQFTFHDHSTVQFDLPSDHKADKFVARVERHLMHVPMALAA